MFKQIDRVVKLPGSSNPIDYFLSHRSFQYPLTKLTIDSDKIRPILVYTAIETELICCWLFLLLLLFDQQREKRAKPHNDKLSVRTMTMK